MATQAQIDANRLNAKQSTGPTTSEGRAKSASNSTSHGLQANPTTIFESNRHERSQYDALKAKLLKQCLPEGELELQAFERYTFALFQVDRARRMETDTQDRWINEPNSETLFNQMERLTKLGAAQERRADKALKEFQKLQTDRILAIGVHCEHHVMQTKVDIPATFPVFEVRKSNLTKTGVKLLADYLLTIHPMTRDILDGKIKSPADRQSSPATKQTRSRRPGSPYGFRPASRQK